MKIHDLNENIEIDEFLGLPALTKKGRMIQQGNKAVKGVLKDELRQMEVELAIWMKQSGIAQLTADDLQSYLDQKGLGEIGQPVIAALPAKADARAAKIKSAIAAKQAAMARGGIKTPTVNNPAPTMATVMSSMYSENIEEAQGTSALSKREVRNILSTVLQTAYKKSAGFSKSSFANQLVAKTKPPAFKSSRPKAKA
jgi:hypothetical protein|tara:strand:- start:2736 stop:3329 length:594 start_codon:yes stop_codon:yes gene_type:complete